MSSSLNFDDGAHAGRDANAPPPPVRRTSNAFGSPGTDSTVKRIDLNDALIRHSDATFVMRAAGDAMQAAGIADGDVLLVDRAITAGHGAIVIVDVDGERLCRRLEMSKATQGPPEIRLVATDAHTAAIVLAPGTPLEVWGVVTTVIKALSF